MSGEKSAEGPEFWRRDLVTRELAVRTIQKLTVEFGV
jgi:hypothetical protein